MKFTLNDANKIIGLYSIGKIKEVKPLSGGLSNYNYEIITSEGVFIIRFSSFKADKKRLQKLELQIKALLFLKENKFKYDVPVPVKNKKNKFINYFKKEPYWIYKKVEGEVYSDLSLVNLKQLADLIAEFHLAIKDFPVKHLVKNFYKYDSLKKDIVKIKARLAKTTKKNEFDILMEKNILFLEKGFKRMSGRDLGTDFIFSHSDWFVGNIVFKNKNISGLIDFDTFEIAPRVKDVACALQLYCFNADNTWNSKLANEFLKQYEQKFKLGKLEKYHLKDHILRESCFAATYFYLRNKKADSKKKLFLLGWALESVRNMLSDIESGNFI